MRHDTRATYFKAHLYSLDCCKYTNYLSIRFYVRTTISMDCIKHYISGYKSCLDNKETVTNCVG